MQAGSFATSPTARGNAARRSCKLSRDSWEPRMTVWSHTAAVSKALHHGRQRLAVGQNPWSGLSDMPSSLAQLSLDSLLFFRNLCHVWLLGILHKVMLCTFLGTLCKGSLSLLGMFCGWIASTKARRFPVRSESVNFPALRQPCSSLFISRGTERSWQ